MRQASTASAPARNDPGRQIDTLWTEHDVGRPEQVDPAPAVPIEGHREHASLGQDRQQATRQLTDGVAPQRQAAPIERFHLDLGAQQEAPQPRRHRVAEAGFDVEQESLPVRPRHPQERRELAVRFEQEGVGRLAHRQPGHVLAQLALQVLHRVGPADRHHVARRAEGARPRPQRRRSDLRARPRRSWPG